MAAHADQLGELVAGQAQLVAFDPEEITDALEVVSGGAALAIQVFIELSAVDRELATDLGDRAVMAAEQLEIGAEVVLHGRSL